MREHYRAKKVGLNFFAKPQGFVVAQAADGHAGDESLHKRTRGTCYGLRLS